MSSTMAQASRIPRPILKRSLLRRTPSAPSKLEALKVQYQERQCQERQRQLAPDSHEDSHQGAADYMVKANKTKRGILRDFFHERRNTDSGNLQYRYQKPIYDDDKVIGYTHHPVLPYHKNSAGRDKSNPLTPIQHVAKPPSGKHSKHSQGRHLQQNGLTPERVLSDTGTNSPGSAGEPLPFQQKPTLVRGRRRSRHASSSSSSTENATVQESVNDSLPLNTAQLHHIHERQREIFSRRHSSTSSDQVALHKPKVVTQPTELLKNAKLSSDSEDEEVFSHGPPRQPMQRPSLRQPARQPPPARQPGMTDFQKWQAEQDHSRRERLRKLQGKRPPDDVDQGWGGQMMPTPPTNKPTQLDLEKKERLQRMRRNILDQQSRHEDGDDSDADKENTTGGGRGEQGGVLGEGNGMTEIQRKEHELMMRIQKGQEELERMKQHRIQAHTQNG
ncbi:hypothetical protein NP493_393g00002 [Ridgeia piscesae]|uniref:Uncharacterized protein n=1 Tax=Ridgeia piscesae TaxID=27915 RepID=A0AAD9L1B0_RIDPI|nr:hypothetical protein NP493_393g00002 [Ridgeia piscesae]